MTVIVRETFDDTLLAEFCHRHWLELGLSPADVAPLWREHTLEFIAAARRDRALAGFVALADDEPVGSAWCQLVERVYPAFRASDTGAIGYVWGVYVLHERRDRGLGAALVTACTERLAALGWGRVLLHTGERARPLYERLGFAPTDELARELETV